ncbi:CRAL TRIO domain containing protein [Asbolus verrucosus]|uniref:CRAL TRIO domain containing protein n=1 Tax=Asbolus verrucosus TaxID=1661398 RepID=A0A482VWZ9_ASBVE|nr:CRAL TRIO domain containing protein [Asbolus verrucosus]
MDVFSVSQDEKDQIRELYNINEEQINENIELIRNWLKKQPHLPQSITDDFIEKVLLRNKFRVERTKQKIDNYYKLRGENRELMKDFQNIVPSKETFIFLPMPKLTPDLERINIMKLTNSDPNRFNIYDTVKCNLAMEELALRYDYAVGDRFVVDYADLSLQHLSKLNPVVLTKDITLFEEAYSCRILSVEFINLPSFVSKILTLFKIVMRPKIYARLRIHDNLESLHKVIPKEYLPSEYGGTFSNVQDLLKKWDEVAVNHHDFFLQNYENISQEHLRIGKTEENEAFGVDGTFKHALLPMPKLTPNLERINVMKLTNPDPDQYNIFNVVKANLAIGELTLQYDYAVGDRFIVDFADFSLKHLTKVNLVILAKDVTLFEEAYSCRICGVELINLPSFVSKILGIFKIIVKPKIYERLRIHDNLESLHKVIPKEYLPSEYGGTFKKWDEVAANHHDFFLQNYENVSQESLRIGKTEENEAFGVDGTFKQLAID